jgi:hypothetical protein
VSQLPFLVRDAIRRFPEASSVGVPAGSCHPLAIRAEGNIAGILVIEELACPVSGEVHDDGTAITYRSERPTVLAAAGPLDRKG